MGKRDRRAKESQEGQPKGVEDEQPQKPMEDKPVAELGKENMGKTLVQRAVQVGLIAIPIAVYVSWAYKKFFPCPRVKCKPQPKPIGKRKLKSSSKTKIPIVCSMLDFTMKRYCTNRANAKQGIAGKNYCECRHVQKPQRQEDPCEMLRYDVRDESYDRGASGRSKNPFASFYEDDYRDEIEASRQEQLYTEDRYRERKHVPERKGRVYKDSEKQQNENSEKGYIEQTSEDCYESLEETIQSLEDKQNKGKIKQNQNSKEGSHKQPLEGSAAEIQQGTHTHKNTSKNIQSEQSSEECEAVEVPTPIMTYCEYLKRPILDYDTQEYPKTDRNVKNSQTERKPSPSTELVVYSPRAKSGDLVKSDGKSEREDPGRSTNLPVSPVNMTQEVMDSLCEQYSREYRKSLLNQQSDSKISDQDGDRTEDVCSDKSIQEIIDRYKTQSVESKQETSPGENDFETVGSTKAKSHDDLCDANFHSLDSDTPFVVKDYTCKTTKSLKRNDASEDKPEEDYENRQTNFWHSCKPPKGLKKGCHPSSKDKGPCD